jgi:hypothetical protein
LIYSEKKAKRPTITVFRQACFGNFIQLRKLTEVGGVEFLNLFFEFFTGAEFDHGTLRNDNFVFGVAGVAALAALADFDFENAEVTQFDIVSGDQFTGDAVEGTLNNIGHIALDDSGFFSDFDNEVTFGHFFSPLLIQKFM